MGIRLTITMARPGRYDPVGLPVSQPVEVLHLVPKFPVGSQELGASKPVIAVFDVK